MKKIIESIFNKQSPLSAAQFEAAYRTHPDTDKDKLSYLMQSGWKQFKAAGHARLRPWVRDGIVKKVDNQYALVG